MPPVPPWRCFLDEKNEHFRLYLEDAQRRWKELETFAGKDERSRRSRERARSFFMADTSRYREVVEAVNASLYLRRPLLLTGNPGSGKTSLAYSVAERLQLGPILKWAITPRSTLRDALYSYDAVARLQAVQQATSSSGTESSSSGTETSASRLAVSNFVKLGPLGTAFLPWERPRVVLIDEIDKCDMSLPNELLELFEEGEFPIPELVREARNKDKQKENESGDSHLQPLVETADTGILALVRGGRVMCREFPLLILTSNGEREFPAAFNRRCIRVRMPDPTSDPEVLNRIVRNHLGYGMERDEQNEMLNQVATDIAAFAQRASKQTGELSVDQLLNLVFLLRHGAGTEADQEGEQRSDPLRKLLLKALGESA